MATSIVIARPAESEHTAYYGGYIARVPGEDLLAYFRSQTNSVASELRGMDDATAMSRYAPGKWSIKEVASHIIDTERVFAYRALCFSRGEKASLPGFAENDYVANGNADERSVSALIEEYEAVRRSTIALFAGCNAEMVMRSGTANNSRFTVRAIGYMIAGHEMHHLAVLAERYLSHGKA